MSLIKELRLFPEELKQSYQGKNSQRLSFLSLYAYFARYMRNNESEEDEKRILLGILIFEVEYYRLNKDYLPSSGGRQFNKVIKAKLKQLAPDCLNDDVRLVCLLHFYKQIQKQSDSLINSHWQEGRSLLLRDIHKVMKSVRKRQSERVALVTEGEPRVSALEKSIVNLSREYYQSKSSTMPESTCSTLFKNLLGNSPNPKREKLISFITWINRTCDDLYPAHTPKDEKEQLKNDVYYMETCLVRLGAYLFILLEIEKEYKNLLYKFFLSPTRSVLFQKCLDNLYQKSLSSIKLEHKIEWLNALANHIASVKKNDGYYRSICQTMKSDDIKNILNFQAKLEEYLLAHQLKKKQPSRTNRYLTTATGYAAQYGLSFALTQAVADIAFPSLTGVAIGSGTGPVGLVVYGAGTIIMTQLGRLVGDKVIPNTISYLYACVLERIAMSIADKTVGVATYSFSATKEGFQSLMNHQNLPDKDKEFLKEWINALLEMPEDIVTANEKHHIRAVLGIEEAPDELLEEETFELIPTNGM